MTADSKAQFKKSSLARFIACGLGLGFIPFAPGTFGSLLGVALGYFMAGQPLWREGLVVLVLFLLGLWAIENSKNLFDKPDASSIVIDEVFGMFISQVGLPKTFGWLCASFLVFRCLDIWKPPGVRYFDRNFKNSLGVILDDGMAGLYTLIALHGFNLVWENIYGTIK